MNKQFYCYMCNKELTQCGYIYNSFNCINEKCTFSSIIVFDRSRIMYYTFFIKNNDITYRLESINSQNIVPSTTLHLVTLIGRYNKILNINSFFPVDNGNDVLIIFKRLLKLSNC